MPAVEPLVGEDDEYIEWTDTVVPPNCRVQFSWLPLAGLSVPRRAHLTRSGPICPEAGLSLPKLACVSRDGPNFLHAGLHE